MCRNAKGHKGMKEKKMGKSVQEIDCKQRGKKKDCQVSHSGVALASTDLYGR